MERKSDYSKQLLDPRWQKKRLDVMQRDNFCCQLCGDNESTLNIHHTHYIYGKKPWEYDISTLKTLCENCHKEITQYKKEAERLIEEYSWLGSKNMIKVMKHASDLFPNDIDMLCDLSEIIKSTREVILRNDMESSSDPFESKRTNEQYDKIFNGMLIQLITEYLNK